MLLAKTKRLRELPDVYRQVRRALRPVHQHVRAVRVRELSQTLYRVNGGEDVRGVDAAD